MSVEKKITVKQAGETAMKMFEMPQNCLHPNALQTVANVSKRIGTSGEVFIDCFRAWVYDNHQSVMSYEEVFATLDRMELEAK